MSKAREFHFFILILFLYYALWATYHTKKGAPSSSGSCDPSKGEKKRKHTHTAPKYKPVLLGSAAYTASSLSRLEQSPCRRSFVGRNLSSSPKLGLQSRLVTKGVISTHAEDFKEAGGRLSVIVTAELKRLKL